MVCIVLPQFPFPDSSLSNKLYLGIVFPWYKGGYTETHLIYAVQSYLIYHQHTTLDTGPWSSCRFKGCFIIIIKMFCHLTLFFIHFTQTITIIFILKRRSLWCFKCFLTICLLADLCKKTESKLGQYEPPMRSKLFDN